MARLLWFGLGFLGGMTYASRVIHREHLDMPPGQAPVTEFQIEQPEDTRSFQVKLADRLEIQAERLGDIIAYKGRELIDALSVAIDHQGHLLAGRLRQSTEPSPAVVSTTSTTYAPGPTPHPNEGGLPSEPHAASPFGEPRPIDLSKMRSPGTAGLEDLR